MYTVRMPFETILCRDLFLSISMYIKNNKDTVLIWGSYLFNSFVCFQIFFKTFYFVRVCQHYIIGDRGPGSSLGLNVGAILCGQIETDHQVALWYIDALFHDTCCNKQVGLMSSKFSEYLKKIHQRKQL